MPFSLQMSKNKLNNETFMIKLYFDFYKSSTDL